jgi:hypothetical protein
MSARHFAQSLGLVELFEEIEKCIRNRFLLHGAIKGFQLGSDLTVGIGGAGTCPAAHTGTPLIFRYVSHSQFNS